MATSRSVGNYSTSAKAVIRASDQIFDAAMSGKPDFTSISKEAIKGRSLVRRAAEEAEGTVVKQGLKSFAETNLTRMKVDTDKAVADIKRPAKRMAGMVAGLGAISGAIITNKGLKRDKAERAELRAHRDKLDAKAELRDAESAARTQELIDLVTTQRNNSGDSSAPSTPAPGGDTSPTNTTQSTTAPTTSSPGIRSDVYTYLTKDKGLSKNKALGLMANIDRESSFRVSPPGGDNGNSFGMFQWNNTYGRSDLMKTNVKDWKTNWRGQIDHALGGNQLPEYNRVSSDFLNTTFDSPQAAADYWMNNWERPADPKSGSTKHSQFISNYNF